MFNEDFEKENRDIIEKIKDINNSELNPDFDEKLFAKLIETEYKRPLLMGKHSWVMVLLDKLNLFAHKTKDILIGRHIFVESTYTPNIEKQISYADSTTKCKSSDIDQDIWTLSRHGNDKEPQRAKRHYRIVPIFAVVSLVFLVSFFVYKYFISSVIPKTEKPNISQTVIGSPKIEKKSLRIFSNIILYNEWSSTYIKRIPNQEYWIDLSKDIFSYLGHSELSSTQVIDAIRVIKGKRFEKEIKRIASLKPSKTAARMDTITLYIKLDPIIRIGIQAPKVEVHPK